MGLRRILALELVLRGTLRDLGPPAEDSPSRHCKEVTESLMVSPNEREDCRAEVEGATDKQHVKPTTAHRMSGMGRPAGRAKMVILAERSRNSQALGQVRGEVRKRGQKGTRTLEVLQAPSSTSIESRQTWPGYPSGPPGCRPGT